VPTKCTKEAVSRSLGGIFTDPIQRHLDRNISLNLTSFNASVLNSDYLCGHGDAEVRNQHRPSASLWEKKMNPSRARATDPSNGWSRVCAENLQFLNLLGPDYFVGFFYVVDGELRDVVEAVLNDTDVNELRGIGDNSLEDPVRLHVGELSRFTARCT
jgi:hypothetical protein